MITKEENGPKVFDFLVWLFKKIQNASKLYPQHTMLKNITLNVHKKEIYKRFL